MSTGPILERERSSGDCAFPLAHRPLNAGGWALGRDRRRQIMLLERSTELRNRPGVRNPLTSQVPTNKLAYRMVVAQRVVGQRAALLPAIHRSTRPPEGLAAVLTDLEGVGLDGPFRSRVHVTAAWLSSRHTSRLVFGLLMRTQHLQNSLAPCKHRLTSGTRRTIEVCPDRHRD